jgi:PBP1b-binding outer membrane lipoprotein LpoB
MTEYAMRYAVLVLAALFIGGCSSRTGVEFSAHDHFELNNTSPFRSRRRATLF